MIIIIIIGIRIRIRIRIIIVIVMVIIITITLFEEGSAITCYIFLTCGPHFWIELKFGVLAFVEGGKPENPEKNPRSREENQQQTQRM